MEKEMIALVKSILLWLQTQHVFQLWTVFVGTSISNDWWLTKCMVQVLDAFGAFASIL